MYQNYIECFFRRFTSTANKEKCFDNDKYTVKYYSNTNDH